MKRHQQNLNENLSYPQTPNVLVFSIEDKFNFYLNLHQLTFVNTNIYLKKYINNAIMYKEYFFMVYIKQRWKIAHDQEEVFVKIIKHLK